LLRGERRQVLGGGGGVVGCVGAVAEDLEEGKVGAVLWGGGEGLDLRGLQELREEVGVWCRGGADDEVGCLARGGGGFG